MPVGALLALFLLLVPPEDEAGAEEEEALLLPDRRFLVPDVLDKWALLPRPYEESYSAQDDAILFWLYLPAATVAFVELRATVVGRVGQDQTTKQRGARPAAICSSSSRAVT